MRSKEKLLHSALRICFENQGEAKEGLKVWASETSTHYMIGKHMNDKQIMFEKLVKNENIFRTF